MFELEIGKDKLLGCVGAGGLLYWCAVHAAKLARYSNPYHFSARSNFRMKDVSLLTTSNNCKLITHAMLLEILEKSKLAEVTINYTRLNTGMFPIHITKTGVLYPRAILCNEGTPGARLFKEWIEEYKMELTIQAVATLQQNLRGGNLYVEPNRFQPNYIAPRTRTSSPKYILPASPPPSSLPLQCVIPQQPPSQYVVPPYSPPPQYSGYSPASPPYVPPQTAPSAPRNSPTYFSITSESPPYEQPIDLTKKSEKTCAVSVCIDTVLPTKICIFNGNDMRTYTCTG